MFFLCSYLHQQCDPHIIHRDIKTSNVLLDSDFNAKVADFGFAKLIPEGVTQLTTRVKGTLGYLAPEYAMWGKVSESCDVYSFGILLFETISGKKPLEKLSGGIKRDIVQWAMPHINRGDFDHIADPRLRGKFDSIQLKHLIVIALKCTDSTPENRPSMFEVVDWLQGGRLGSSSSRKIEFSNKLVKEYSEEETIEVESTSINSRDEAYNTEIFTPITTEIQSKRNS
ncbi:transmembrane signal receptor [Lithospermum erythrorhizon]|uniref:Transmembrane signal receptor n=1 Tax=Lithospermum erythrorhizon TaxID=34254 RepID=A0AAV3QK59_LITER